MIENEDEVKEFLADYPSPAIVTATTIKDGFVTCIKPIKTICGAELMCSPNTRQSVVDLVRGQRGA